MARTSDLFRRDDDDVCYVVPIHCCFCVERNYFPVGKCDKKKW